MLLFGVRFSRFFHMALPWTLFALAAVAAVALATLWWRARVVHLALRERLESRLELVDAGRQRMEYTLQQLQFAVDNTPEAMFTLSPEGRILDVNETTCRQLEYPREELLAMTIADLDPNYPLERWPQEWEILRDKRQLVAETVHRAKGGRPIPV